MACVVCRASNKNGIMHIAKQRKEHNITEKETIFLQMDNKKRK